MGRTTWSEAELKAAGVTQQQDDDAGGGVLGLLGRRIEELREERRQYGYRPAGWVGDAAKPPGG